jgi:hypothetical protein
MGQIAATAPIKTFVFTLHCVSPNFETQFRDEIMLAFAQAADAAIYHGRGKFADGEHIIGIFKDSSGVVCAKLELTVG